MDDSVIWILIAAVFFLAGIAFAVPWAETERESEDDN